MTTAPAISSAVEAERRLVDHYLRSDGPCGGAPLRFIDATDHRLREALQLPDGVEPMSHLAAACGDVGHARRLFAEGPLGRWPDPNAPGYFRHLVLTCAITAGAVSNAETRNFRINLARAFGAHDALVDLHGLPGLWADLRAWCENKRRKGLPYRAVALPAHPSYRYVGYSQDMTFPAWRDVVRLQAVAKHEAIQRITDANRAALSLARAVRRDVRFSEPMRRVADEYLKYQAAGSAMLHEHPFRAVLPAVLNAGALRERSRPQLRIELRFHVDVDDAELSCSVIGAKANAVSLEGVPGAVMPSLKQWLARCGLWDDRAPLCRLVSEATIPFFEESYGVWVASDRQSEPPRPCRVLWRSDRSSVVARLVSMHSDLGTPWLLTDVLAPTNVRTVLDAIGLDAVPSARIEILRTDGGWQTESGYLGRPTALPRVWAPPGTSLSLETADEEGKSIPLVPVGGGFHEPDASAALDGTYRLRVEERIEGADPLTVERVLTFVADAPEYTDYRAPDPGRSEIVRETIAGAGSPCATHPASEDGKHAWPCVRFDDFLETVYAGGRSGWSEQALFSAAQTILGREAPSTWDVLRSLEESGWLQATYSPTWGARRWWLAAPTLVCNSEDATLVLLRGSAASSVRSRLTGVAERLGGIVSACAGVGPYSPVTVFAKGVRAVALSRETGIPLKLMGHEELAPAPACWPRDGCNPGSHKLASRWNWTVGRFEMETAHVNPVRVVLERYRREARDRRDIFRVYGGGQPPWTGWSRVAAICEAHRRAGTPLFRLEGRLLLRTARDGHLPLSLAQRAWLASARHSGPVGEPGAWQYAYCTNHHEVEAVRQLLGRDFVDGPGSDAPASGVDIVAALGVARHRPHLRTGFVVAKRTRPSFLSDDI